MSNIIADMISEKGFLLADGATGTNLFNLGLEAGEPPEFWNLNEPDKIRSIGPTGDIMGDAGWLSHNDAVKVFQVTAQGLIDGGADVLWLETISSPEEYIAASEAIESINAPWVGTMSFDTAGRTMMGVTSHDMSNLVRNMQYGPIAYGANCGVGASDLLRTVLGLSEKSDRPIIAKGNAGIPKYIEGHIHYDGTPEVMSDYALLARACGASIIGGCCGTMPIHLKAMRYALDNNPVGDVPSLDQISKSLGPFSSETDGTGDGPKPVRVRRGQRK